MLERTSSPKESPDSCAAPVDIELSKSELWEMDLSPGTEIVPESDVGRLTVSSKIDPLA